MKSLIMLAGFVWFALLVQGVIRLNEHPICLSIRNVPVCFDGREFVTKH